MSQLLVSLQNSAVSNGYDAKNFKDQMHEIQKQLALASRRKARAVAKVDELNAETARLIAELARVAGVAG